MTVIKMPKLGVKKFLIFLIFSALISLECFQRFLSMTWPDLMDHRLNKLETVPADPASYTASAGPRYRRERLRRVLSSDQSGVKDVEGAIDALSWLGLLGLEETGILGVGDRPAVELIRELPMEGDCPIEALSALLTAHRGLAYQQGERDMVAMYHTVVGVMPDGTEERHTSRLMAFGAPVGGDKERRALGRKEDGDKDKSGEGGGAVEQEEDKEGDTAMSATVGFTTALAVELLLQLNLNAVKGNSGHAKGGIDDPRYQAVGPLGGRAGVIIPITADIYDPILHRLNDLGITWTESVTVTDPRS
jgi:Saccharopine dehydrogenase C-terminal domain